MGSQKKDIVKLSEQGIVTEEALVAYLHNKLTAEEKQELEKLLDQDPFARDALEGLQKSENKTAVTGSLSTINRRVRERSGLKEKRTLQIHWTNYAWAAVLVGLLIGIGFIMINFIGKKDGQIAINTKQKEQKPTVILPVQKQVEKPADTNKITIVDTAVSIKVSGSGSLTMANGTYAPATTGSTAGNSVAQQVTTSKPDQNKLTSADYKASPSPSGPTGQTAAAKPVAPSSMANSTVTATTNGLGGTVGYNFTTTTAPASNAGVGSPGRTQQNDQLAMKKVRADTTYDQRMMEQVVASKSKAEFRKEEKAESEAERLDAAMKNFNLGDYNVAGEEFDKVLKKNGENGDALYYGGICDYINGKTAKAENNFDKLLKHGTKYVDGAKWYKANILLKKGNKEAAKTLLQDLTSGNGSYKERAVKKMSELGF